MNNRGNESGVTHDIKPMADRPVVDPPILSQITCLGGPADVTDDINTGRIHPRKDETSFVKLCRDGGHKGLLEMQEHVQNNDPVTFKRQGGDWYYHEQQSENGDLATGRSNLRDTDSEFVRLSKQGGHEGLLRIDSGSRSENPFVNSHGRYIRKEERVSPSTCPPAGMKPADVNVVPGNPIWLGGSGPEMGFVPGKRFVKKEFKESPFAVSSDWMGTQSRNPDKI
ncbi:uncharacterized protein LOC114517842 [Dendronephthya gigantea]|uniref:uncharacterized protein LOC114517842 n=1 Tax=Dendronephthya gigantea TaxID=151771 RepID=UPI00106DAD13|nr:uncharacterized protein LOC114517842 [Dendronephthya gigantea]